VKRVLVTGAGGFIGSHVMHELANRGVESYGLVRSTTSLDRLRGLEPHASVRICDLEDAGAVRRTLAEIQADTCIHCAWFVEPGKYLADVVGNLVSLDQSVRLVRHLVDQGCGRLVLSGTCLENAGASVTPYGSAKRALHVLGEGLRENLAVVCAHIFYLFGPWERTERLVPTMIRSALANSRVAVTAGAQVLHYLHVADIASALCEIAASSVTGGIDVCAGRPIRMRELFDVVGRATGRPELIRVGERPYGPAEVFSAVGDPTPLGSLGWKPTFSLETGIEDAVSWWMAQSNRIQK
jgi:nucleoside-diphosphate-sugar epimerase